MTVKTRRRTKAQELEETLERADAALAAVRRTRQQAKQSDKAKGWYRNLPPGTIDNLIEGWRSGDLIEKLAARASDPRERRLRSRQLTKLGEYAHEAVEALLGLALKDVSFAGKTQDEASEMRNEARTLLLEFLYNWRPMDGHSVEAYVASRSSWVRSEVRAQQDPFKTDRSWYATRAAAYAAKEELERSLGRTPTLDEIRDAAEVRLRRAVAEGTKSQTPLSEEAITARLTKDGKTKALSELAGVLASGQTVRSMHTPVGEDGDTLGDLIADCTSQSDSWVTLDQLMNVALGDELWARDALLGRFGVLAAVDGAAADPRAAGEGRLSAKVSYQVLAEQTGRDASTLRQLVKRAKSRLIAPHAHFLALGNLNVEVARSSMLGGYERSDFAD